MLTVWKFKVLRRFATREGEVLLSVKRKRGRELPPGVFAYKPTHREWDYVDYTGVHRGREVEFNDVTCYLELLGFIKFVEVENGETGN